MAASSPRPDGAGWKLGDLHREAGGDEAAGVVEDADVEALRGARHPTAIRKVLCVFGVFGRVMLPTMALFSLSTTK